MNEDTLYGNRKTGGKVDRNREMVQLWKGGMSQKDVAKKFGITPPRFRRILLRTLDREKP